MSNTPPSMESELAVLSILFRHPDFIFNTSGLKETMFSARTHSNIYSTMLSLASRNLLPDPSLFINEAINNGTLDACGGKDYISYLCSLQEYKPENFQEFIRTIKNSYKVQSLISFASTINLDTIVVNNVDEYIGNLQSRLDSLRGETAGDGTYHIGSLIKDSFNEIVDRLKNPGIRGSTTGIQKIDSLTGGFCGGDLWYIGARPGQGKSALMCTHSLHMAKAGISTLIFSKEMTRQPIIERLLSMDSGIPFFDIRMGLLNQQQVDTVYESANKISKYPIHIDLNFTGSIEQIESVTRKYHSLHNVSTVFIDYIQLLSERSADQTQELGRISRRLKLLANSLNISIVVLSQLNREVEHRDNKRPVMADLRQCGNLEEDADFVIGLYRDDYYNPKDSKEKDKIEYIILKQRNGPTGTIMLGFDSSTVQVKED